MNMNMKAKIGVAGGALVLGAILVVSLATLWRSEGEASQPSDFDRAVDGVIDHIDEQPRSSFQQDLLKDGVLSEDEYDLAFSKFAECVTAAGGVLDGDGTKNQWGVYDAGVSVFPVEYGVPNTQARLGVDQCNAEYFDVVGQRWQAAHPVPREALQEEFAKIPDCMRAKGLEPPEDLSRGWAYRYMLAHPLEESRVLDECVLEANRNLGMPKSVVITP